MPQTAEPLPEHCYRKGITKPGPQIPRYWQKTPEMCLETEMNPQTDTQAGGDEAVCQT